MKIFKFNEHSFTRLSVLLLLVLILVSGFIIVLASSNPIPSYKAGSQTPRYASCPANTQAYSPNTSIIPTSKTLTIDVHRASTTVTRLSAKTPSVSYLPLIVTASRIPLLKPVPEFSWPPKP